MSTLSPDGTMHLDLVDAVSSNGTHPEYANIETSVEAMKSPMPPQNIEDSAENQSRPCSEEAKSEQDVSLVKKKIKPPMPPSKDARPSATPVTSDQSINKVCIVFVFIFFHPSNPFIQSVLVIVERVGHISVLLPSLD